jgi:hypothetical protein
MQHMSLEQYLLLITHPDRRYEYYDGEVSLLADGSSNHAAIALNFAVALFDSVAITAGYQSPTRVPEFDWVRQSTAFPQSMCEQASAGIDGLIVLTAQDWDSEVAE